MFMFSRLHIHRIDRIRFSHVLDICFVWLMFALCGFHIHRIHRIGVFRAAWQLFFAIWYAGLVAVGLGGSRCIVSINSFVFMISIWMIWLAVCAWFYCCLWSMLVFPCRLQHYVQCYCISIIVVVPHVIGLSPLPSGEHVIHAVVPLTCECVNM